MKRLRKTDWEMKNGKNRSWDGKCTCEVQRNKIEQKVGVKKWNER